MAVWGYRPGIANVDDYRKHPENWLPVSWQPSADRYFSSEIRIEVANKMGVLAAVAAAVAGNDTNIERVSLEERDAETSSLTFELKFTDRKHLARIIRVIRAGECPR